MTHTLPNYKHHVTSGQSETKQQSRTRNDVAAASIYSKRLDIDRLREAIRLQRELKEMEL